MSKDAWVHLHLPRLSSGDLEMISVKHPGERVRYRNLVGLESARFVVNERGRLRAVRENVRNVHAWVVGTLTFDHTLPSLRRVEEMQHIIGEAEMRRAIYDPWKGDSFVDSETLEPIERADAVLCVGKLVYYRLEQS